MDPDGSDLAVVRRVDGRERLEFPIGKVLYDTSGYISHIRFSPDGKRIAFADHPLYADDNGDLAVIDREGRKTTLGSGFQGLRGVCWSLDGSEVWFTIQNLPHAGVALRAAALDGRTRTVLSLPTDFRLLDIARDGRLLIATENVSRHIEVRREGQTLLQEVNLLDQHVVEGAVPLTGGRRAAVERVGDTRRPRPSPQLLAAPLQPVRRRRCSQASNADGRRVLWHYFAPVVVFFRGSSFGLTYVIMNGPIAWIWMTVSPFAMA